MGWSTAAYTSIVLVVNFQLLLNSRSLTIISAVGFGATLLLYFLSLIALSVGPVILQLYPLYYGVFTHYGLASSFWLSIFLVVFTCAIVSITYETLVVFIFHYFYY